MDERGRSARQRGIDEAMGEAIYAAAMDAKKKGEDLETHRPFESLMKEVDARAKEINALDKDEQALLEELCSFFDIDRTEGDKKKEVIRAKEIIEELQMNVDFPALPYGETFLSGAINHSLGMVEMLIEKGADVNKENEMMCECAIDKILEEEEYNDGLSDETKSMKKLLLSKGAKTAEERLRDMTALIRKGDDDEDSEDDE